MQKSCRSHVENKFQTSSQHSTQDTTSFLCIENTSSYCSMQDTTTSSLCIKVGFIQTLSESGNNDGYGVNVYLG